MRQPEPDPGEVPAATGGVLAGDGPDGPGVRIPGLEFMTPSQGDRGFRQAGVKVGEEEQMLAIAVLVNVAESMARFEAHIVVWAGRVERRA